jgi:predicted DsbA family dithiol-disulfide isomerase
LGLDVQKVLAAVDGETHKPLIEADKKIAEGAKITGTPSFVINGYYISGAQPSLQVQEDREPSLGGSKVDAAGQV